MEDSHGGYGKRAVEGEDLQEEEVWGMINAREGSKYSSERDLSSSSFAWRVGEESSPPQRTTRHQPSAPVKIPDRSNIQKKRSKKVARDGACDAHNYDSGVDAVRINEEEEEEEDEAEMAPPHEVLSRRLARTRIASHSMCEGVGRTLKGRDLSKTRNAILTKTGFIE